MCGSDDKVYVLKRMLVERGEAVLRAGLREIYFGELLTPSTRVARFVEAFTVTHDLSGKISERVCVWIEWVEQRVTRSVTHIRT